MPDLAVWSIPMRTRFRGITVREGVLLRGEAGWGEWSPFLEYDARESLPWLRCAEEAAAGDWPEPVRDRIYFAGEAVHETQWGTVGGAWESGERAAEAVLRRMGALKDPAEQKQQQQQKKQQRRRRSRDKT